MLTQYGPFSHLRVNARCRAYTRRWEPFEVSAPQLTLAFVRSVACANVANVVYGLDNDKKNHSKINGYHIRPYKYLKPTSRFELTLPGFVHRPKRMCIEIASPPGEPTCNKCPSSGPRISYAAGARTFASSPPPI